MYEQLQLQQNVYNCPSCKTSLKLENTNLVIFKNKIDGRLYFDVFHSQMRGVLSEIWDAQGNIIQEAIISRIYPSEYKYSLKKCRFVDGRCNEDIVEISKKSLATSEFDRVVESKYKNGIWEVYASTSQGESKIKQRSVFDRHGFPLYLIIYGVESIDNEYVRLE